MQIQKVYDHLNKLDKDLRFWQEKKIPACILKYCLFNIIRHFNEWAMLKKNLSDLGGFWHMKVLNNDKPV